MSVAPRVRASPVTHIQVDRVRRPKTGHQRNRLTVHRAAAESYVTVPIPCHSRLRHSGRSGRGLTQLAATKAISVDPPVVNVSSTRILASPPAESPSLTFALTV